MIAIALLDKQLWIQEAQVNKHQRYFLKLLRDNSFVVPVMLIPAFFAGWKSGRMPDASRMFRQIGKFVGLAIMTHIKGR